MVRLMAPSFLNFFCTFVWFQFLYGTINGKGHTTFLLPQLLFQFLYGTINGLYL